VKQQIGMWKYPRWIEIVDSLAEDRDGEDSAVQAEGLMASLDDQGHIQSTARRSNTA
jgi:hypothetical protein